MLADFANTTGDAVYDDTLKQALAVDLEQSPFLNVLADNKVSETLKLMGRTPGERLTREVAREICVRTGNSKGHAVGIDFQPGQPVRDWAESRELPQRRPAGARSKSEAGGRRKAY